MRNTTVRAALKLVDEDGSGTLSREEVKKMLHTYYLIKYTDFYTGETRGEIEEKVVDTLMDFVDKSGDGKIDYEHFTKMLHEKDMQTNDLWQFESHVINEIDGHEGGRGAIHDHNREGQM